jgi:hypothetical protein
MPYCTGCATALNATTNGIPLPVEPLYDRESVCLLVPIKLSTLARWISKNPWKLDGPYYTGSFTRCRRLFTATDIRTLRAAMVRSTPRGRVS